MTSTPVSTALIGYGLGGRVFHAPLIRTTDDLSLDVIVTSDPGRQQQARDAFPDAEVVGTVEEAWSAGCSLAVITTANVTHVPYAQGALAAGLHVVLDKPIAPTADAAADLARRATEADRLLVPFQNRRWDSEFLTIRAVAASGRLGRVHRFESRIERMRVVPKGGWRDSVDPADMGGMLYDLGSHIVDQALAFMGPVRSVDARIRSVRDAAAPDDDVVVVLEHVDGGVSLLIVSQVGAFPGPRLTAFGTRGGLRIYASDSQEVALAAGTLPGPGWGVEPEDAAAHLREFDDASAVTSSRIPLVPGDWPSFYAAVAAAIVDGSAPPVEVADVVANLRVMDAARESSRTGERVTLTPAAGHASPIA